jgi:hypothetical protein
MKRAKGEEGKMPILSDAGQMGTALKGMHEELGRAIDTRHSLQIRLLRLRQARQELSDCERTAKSGDRAAICHQAKQALLPALELANQEEAGEGLGGEEDWQAEERQKELVNTWTEWKCQFCVSTNSVGPFARVNTPSIGPN